jgi:hypothetical protein
VVLQVILIDRYFEHFANGNRDEFNNTSIKIGRNFIPDASKMPTFAQYVRKALEKLELDVNLLTDSEIDGYYARHGHLKKRFDAYVQLKLIIAPVIEYVILLDRLVYMCEMTGGDETTKYEHHLVRLFDAAKSPRCHALVSFVNN